MFCISGGFFYNFFFSVTGTPPMCVCDSWRQNAWESVTWQFWKEVSFLPGLPWFWNGDKSLSVWSKKHSIPCFRLFLQVSFSIPTHAFPHRKILEILKQDLRVAVNSVRPKAEQQFCAGAFTGEFLQPYPTATCPRISLYGNDFPTKWLISKNESRQSRWNSILILCKREETAILLQWN